jgi:hypothetical protein
MNYSLICTALLAVFAAAAQAQTIERVKMTDGDMTCQQLYAETVDMDAVIAKNKPAPGAVPVASSASQTAGVATQAEGVANIAQGAATISAYSGSFGGFGAFSSLGSLIGGAAKMAQGSAAQQAATDAVAQQKAVAEQQAMAQMTGQAQARKEHVTSLFLSKPCKMSEIQK